MILWEWVRVEDLHGDRGGALSEWREGMQSTERALLDSKIGVLEVTTNAALLPNFMAGPISVKGTKYPDIYKLLLGGKIRLRPLLCKGPMDKNREVTFLLGAYERNGKFDPANAPGAATDRLKKLLNKKAGRRRYGTPPKATIH